MEVQIYQSELAPGADLQPREPRIGGWADILEGSDHAETLCHRTDERRNE